MNTDFLARSSPLENWRTAILTVILFGIPDHDRLAHGPLWLVLHAASSLLLAYMLVVLARTAAANVLTAAGASRNGMLLHRSRR